MSDFPKTVAPIYISPRIYQCPMDADHLFSLVNSDVLFAGVREISGWGGLNFHFTSQMVTMTLFIAFPLCEKFMKKEDSGIGQRAKANQNGPSEWSSLVPTGLMRPRLTSSLDLF